MEKVAITGRVASGKSVVARACQRLGYPVLEADEIVADLYQTDELKDIIQDYFGYAAFTPSGKIDKKWLRNRIFTNEKDRQWLEQLLWPRVWSAYELWWVKNRQQSLVFAVVPLLFEAGWQDRFDQIWLVTSPKEEALTRLQLRDHLSFAQAKVIYDLTIPDRQKRGLVNVIINNCGTISSLEQTVTRLLSSDDGKLS